MDSNSIVKCITGDCPRSFEGRSLVRRIRPLLAMEWIVTIKHVYREANKVADGLVDLGCSLGENNPYVLFDTPPNRVKQYVAHDVIGVSTHRLILA